MSLLKRKTRPKRHNLKVSHMALVHINLNKATNWQPNKTYNEENNIYRKHSNYIQKKFSFFYKSFCFKMNKKSFLWTNTRIHKYQRNITNWCSRMFWKTFFFVSFKSTLKKHVLMKFVYRQDNRMVYETN